MKDEAYILDLCDQVLHRASSRHHRFPFLVGDTGVSLPVDAYYPDLNLVIEYRERQHFEAVLLFDRRETVSGVSRGKQRQIYDQRRRDVLPKHGIEFVEINYFDFSCDERKRLRRQQKRDLEVLRSKLAHFLPKE